MHPIVHPRVISVHARPSAAFPPLRPLRVPWLRCLATLLFVMSLARAQDSSSSADASSSTGAEEIIDPAYFPPPPAHITRVRIVFAVADLPASVKASPAELAASTLAGNPNPLSSSFPDELGRECVLFFQQLASDYDDPAVAGVALTQNLLVNRVFYASPLVANSDLSRVTLFMEWSPLTNLFNPAVGYVRLKNDLIDPRGDHRHRGYAILSQIVGLAALCVETGSEFEGSYALACGPDPPPDVREANWWWAGLCGLITMVAETLLLGLVAFQMQRMLTPDAKLSAEMDDLRARKLAKEVAKIQAAQLAAQGGIPTVPIAMQASNQVGQAPDEPDEADIVIPMHGEEDDAMNTASISSRSRAYGDGLGKSPLFLPSKREESVSMSEFGRARDESQGHTPGHNGHHHNPLSMGGSMDFALASPSAGHRNNVSSVSGYGTGLAPVHESDDDREPRRNGRTAMVPEEGEVDSPPGTAVPASAPPRKFQLLRQDTRDSFPSATGTPRAVREESVNTPMLFPAASPPRATREESFFILPAPHPRAIREESFSQSNPSSSAHAIMPAAKPAATVSVPLSPQQPMQIMAPVARRPIQPVAATPTRAIIPLTAAGAPPPLQTVPLGQPSPHFGQAIPPPYAVALAAQQANTGAVAAPQPGPSPPSTKRSVVRRDDDDD